MTMGIMLNENLRKLLREENISKVAKELNIPKQRLHDWSYGGVVPNFSKCEYILKLANYFGLSFEELVFGRTKDMRETYRFYSNAGALIIVSVIEGE